MSDRFSNVMRSLCRLAAMESSRRLGAVRSAGKASRLRGYSTSRIEPRLATTPLHRSVKSSAVQDCGIGSYIISRTIAARHSTSL